MPDFTGRSDPDQILPPRARHPRPRTRTSRRPSMTGLWNTGGFHAGPDERADAAYTYGLD